MMKKIIKTEDEDFEIKFWKEWLEADSLEKLDMVEKLPIVTDFCNINWIKMPESLKKHSFALMLNGFFEDLEAAVYTKIRLDKKRDH